MINEIKCNCSLALDRLKAAVQSTEVHLIKSAFEVMTLRNAGCKKINMNYSRVHANKHEKFLQRNCVRVLIRTFVHVSRIQCDCSLPAAVGQQLRPSAPKQAGFGGGSRPTLDHDLSASGCWDQLPHRVQPEVWSVNCKDTRWDEEQVQSGVLQSL